MAKVQNPLHSDRAAGSVSNTTFQRYRRTTHTKTRVGPSQTMTERQIGIRAITSVAVARWKSISQTYRDQWEAFAKTISPNDGEFGSQNWSGYNAFVSCQVTCLRHHEWYLDGPTTNDPPPVALDPVVTQDFGGIHLQWDPFSAPAGSTYVVELWVAGVHSAGRNPKQNMSKYVTADNANGGVCTYTPWENGWFSLFYRTVDIDTGLRSDFRSIRVNFTQ